MIQTRKEVLLNAVATTTTSRGVGVDNAGRISFQLIATGVSTGSGTLTVDVSNDEGATWTPYNRLIPNLVGTNAQTDAFVASRVIAATGSSMIFVPAGDTFGLVRAKVTVATDGSYSVVAFIN